MGNRWPSSPVEPHAPLTDRVVQQLTNLDLKQLAPDCTLQSSSASEIDNVEQVRATPDSGGQEVLYGVEANSTVDGMGAEPFSLAATNQLTPLVSPAPTVTLSSSANEVEPGQDVTITAAVANPSPDLTADQASVTLSLPTGVELVSGGPNQQLGSLSRQRQAGDSGIASWVVRPTQAGTSSVGATTGAVHCGEQFFAKGAALITATSPAGEGSSPSTPPEPLATTQPGPTAPNQSSPALTAARLRVRKAWTPKGLRLSGSLAHGATGRVTVTYTVGRHRIVTVHGARFQLLIRDRRAHRRRLTVRYAGDRRHRGQTVRVRG